MSDSRLGSASLASALLSGQQDVAEWCNAVVASHGDESSSLDAHVSAVSMKLQILAADLNDELEASMAELLAAVPRTLAEVDRIEGAVETLRADLTKLTARLDTLSDSTSQHVHELEELDRVKRNMETCAATLVEAANWSAAVREANSKFAAGALPEAAERLAAMQHSEEVLRSMPESAERRRTLAQLRDQLEVLLKPKLLQALQKERVASLRQYVDMYRQLDRLDVFQSEYCRARPAQLHRYWFTFSGHDDFASWLPAFHEQVLGMILEERRRCAEIFGAGAVNAVVVEIITETITPITPSFVGRLRGTGTTSLPVTVELFTETMGFLRQALGYLDSSCTAELVRVVSEPYKDLQQEYGPLESAHMTLQVDAIFADDPAADDESADAISSYLRQVEQVASLAPKVFGVVEAAQQRCVTFTSGAQSKPFLKAVAAALSHFLQKLTLRLQAMRTATAPEHRAGAPPPPSRDADAGTKSAAAEAPPVPPQAPPARASFDWQYLQGSLELLQAIGKWHRRFVAHEKALSRMLQQLCPVLCEGVPVPGDSPAAESSGDGPRDLTMLVAQERIRTTPQTLADLKSLLGLSASTLPGELLPAPFRDIQALAAEARGLIFDTCFGVIRTRFADVSALDTWCADSDSAESSAYDILPQGYVTQAGEHLLSLCQHLEPFAANDGLPDACAAMDGLSRLGEAEWRQLSVPLALSDSELSGTKQIMEGSSISGVTLAADDTAENEEEDAGAADGAAAESPAAQFCNDWLTCVARATTGAFLTQVLRIPKLDNRGAQHLAADTGYLINVLRALDLPAHALLKHLRYLALAPKEELSSLLEGRLPTHSPAAAVVGKINRRFGAMRGLAVPFSE